MVDVTNKQQIWQSRIEECQNSSMSVKQWCQENQVAYSTYLYWARKLRTSADPEQDIHTEEMVFAQLPSEQEIRNVPQRRTSPVSMFLGTVRIEISSNCPQNLLHSLIEVLNHYA